MSSSTLSNSKNRPTQFTKKNKKREERKTRNEKKKTSKIHRKSDDIISIV
jgi:hypothetical protein